MSGRPEHRHLIVFAKAPVLGRVKRRLAREIGAVDAWVFFRRTAEGVVRRLARDPRWRTWLAVTPDSMVRAGRWPAPRAARMGQGKGDLGRRMDRAMRAPPPGCVLLVGSDIPDLRPAHVAAAFRALGAHDFVFGPAADGGYWLVGARRRPNFPYLFERVRWSTPQALADTLRNARRKGRCALVAMLADVDDRAAWLRCRARSGMAAPPEPESARRLSRAVAPGAPAGAA